MVSRIITYVLNDIYMQYSISYLFLSKIQIQLTIHIAILLASYHRVYHIIDMITFIRIIISKAFLSSCLMDLYGTCITLNTDPMVCLNHWISKSVNRSLVALFSALVYILVNLLFLLFFGMLCASFRHIGSIR